MSFLSGTTSVLSTKSRCAGRQSARASLQPHQQYVENSVTPTFDSARFPYAANSQRHLCCPIIEVARSIQAAFLTAVRPALSEVVHAFPQQLTTPPIFPYKPLLVPFLLLLVPVSSGRLRARWLRLRRPSLPKRAPAPSASSRFPSASSVPGTQFVQSPPIMNISGCGRGSVAF
jgi:hypothetical protein